MTEPGEWYWYRLFVGEAHRNLGLIASERKGRSADREFAEAERIARDVLKEAPEPDPRQQLAEALTARWEGSAALAGRARRLMQPSMKPSHSSIGSPANSLR